MQLQIHDNVKVLTKKVTGSEQVRASKSEQEQARESDQEQASESEQEGASESVRDKKTIKTTRCIIVFHEVIITNELVV